ncbi:MAG: hypothetical protein AAGA17_00075 [Actinomycetota bacterium]
MEDEDDGGTWDGAPVWLFLLAGFMSLAAVIAVSAPLNEGLDLDFTQQVVLRGEFAGPWLISASVLWAAVALWRPRT